MITIKKQTKEQLDKTSKEFPKLLEKLKENKTPIKGTSFIKNIVNTRKDKK